ncbi:MAG: hypothetical protein RJA59_2108 [Pseudomonadota bacterium]
MGPQLLRIGRATGITLLALELAYLLAANLALSTGLVRRAVSAYPESVLLTHGRAYTVLPGRVHVSDLSMRVQDRNIQFHLTVAQVRVDVDLLALLRNRFHGDHVRCEGASFRFVHRVRDAKGMEARLDAYPPIPGLARPALFQVPPPPEPTKEEIDALWTVRLDDVAVDLRELWFLEHRWEGNGSAKGGFELSPVRQVQVGPAELRLEGGVLRAGPHVVSEDLRLRVNATVDRFDVQALDGMQVFRPISGAIQLEAKDFSPALLALYVPGLAARGAGSFLVDLDVESGRIGSGARAELKMKAMHAGWKGFAYDGAPALTGSFDAASDPPAVPRIHLKAPGSLVVPIPPDGSARVDFLGLRADVTLTGNDIADGITLEMLSASLEEGRVLDARDVGAAVTHSLPLFFVPLLLGHGPLVISGGVDARKGVTIARLLHASLGIGELRGAARTSTGGWDGAAAGHFGFLPIGIRLRDGDVKVALFVSGGWLDAELAATGIRFENPLLVHREPARR